MSLQIIENENYQNQLLENYEYSDNSGIIKDYIFYLINELFKFVTETDVDNIQNKLELIYSQLVYQNKIDEQVFTKDPSIIDLCFTIFENTENIIYLRCLCLRIFVIILRRCPSAINYMLEKDFFHFISYCLDSGLITIIRPTFQLLSAAFQYEPARQEFFEDTSILNKIFDMLMEVFFENNMRNRRILEDSIYFLKEFVYYCPFPSEYLLKLVEMIHQCFGNNITFIIQNILIIISKIAEQHLDFILNETDLFKEVSQLINNYWEEKDNLGIIQYAARCLSTILYKNTKFQWSKKPELFDIINPEIFIRIFKRHYKETKVLKEISILIADLLIKGPQELAQSFFSITLLGAMNFAYQFASSEDKEYFLNLFWLLAKGASPEQLEELVSLQCFTKMLEIFEYDNDFIPETLDVAVFPILHKIYMIFPMDHKIWNKIHEAIEEGLSSENEKIEEKSGDILKLVESWENETEEQRLDHINQLEFSRSKPENIPVPPVKDPDEDTFSELPIQTPGEEEEEEKEF